MFAIPLGSHFCDDHLSILVEDIVGICIFITNEECRTVGTALVGNEDTHGWGDPFSFLVDDVLDARGLR
mgnify:CR=1 FL=1